MANLPLQNFITAQTIVTAAWLNQVDAITHPFTLQVGGGFILAPPTSGIGLSIAGMPTGAFGFSVTGAAAGVAVDGYTVSNTNSTGITQGLVVGNDTINTLNAGKSGSASSALFTGAPAGDLSWLQSGGPTPLAIVAGTTVQALFRNTGINTLAPSVALPAGGALNCGILFSSVANLGLFFGTGAPTFSAAEGSFYSNTTGAAGARLYVNTSSGSGATWTPATSP